MRSQKIFFSLVIFIFLLVIEGIFFYYLGQIKVYKFYQKEAFFLERKTLPSTQVPISIPQAPISTFAIFGKIQKIQENNLIIKGKLFLNDSEEKEWGITISQNTEILKGELKPREVLEKEAKEYQEKLQKFLENQSGTPFLELPPHPSLFFESQAGISEIEIGKNVFLEAKGDPEDKGPFEAKKIILVKGEFFISF